MNKEGNQTDPYTKGKKYGYHSYMVERFVELLGEDETSQLLLFNETKLNKNIRLNSLRSAPHRTVDLLQEKKVQFKTIEGIPEALEITERMLSNTSYIFFNTGKILKVIFGELLIVVTFGLFLPLLTLGFVFPTSVTHCLSYASLIGFILAFIAVLISVYKEISQRLVTRTK